MSNYNDELYLSVLIVPKHEINETTLVPIFDHDGDYSDNKEYFRPKTRRAKMTESQMCAKEVYNNCKSEVSAPIDVLRAMMDTAIGYHNGEQGFLIGNNVYCKRWQYKLTEVGDSIVISLAWVS